jgi:hypothetical protein
LEKLNEDIEIDLLELFFMLKRRFWLLVLSAVLGGALCGAYTYFLIAPKYSSTAMLYILSKETTLTSLADLQIGSQLTKDYKVLVVSKPVLQEVINKLDLKTEYKDLKAKVSISNPADTRILTITVLDKDATRARDTVNEIALSASNYIAEIMEMVPPKIIEKGETALQKTSPSTTKNTAIGALSGILLVCIITGIQLFMKDTIDSEEDAQKYLGLSVLATIPKDNLE